jgi:hypothetical protein
MWEHTKELETYGFGYPLWFSFLKYCIILMLVLIASKTANEMYMAATENWEFCYGEQVLDAVKEGEVVHSGGELKGNGSESGSDSKSGSVESVWA